MKSYTTPTIRISLSEERDDIGCPCHKEEETSGILDDVEEIRVSMLSESGEHGDFPWPGPQIEIEGDCILLKLNEADTKRLVGRCEIEATAKTYDGSIFKTSTKRITVKDSLRDSMFYETWPEGEEIGSPEASKFDSMRSFYNLPKLYDEVLSEDGRFRFSFPNPVNKVRMVFYAPTSSFTNNDNTIRIYSDHKNEYPVNSWYGTTSRTAGSCYGELLFDNTHAIPCMYGSYGTGEWTQTVQNRLYDFNTDAFKFSANNIKTIGTTTNMAAGTRVIIYAE